MLHRRSLFFIAIRLVAYTIFFFMAFRSRRVTVHFDNLVLCLLYFFGLSHHRYTISSISFSFLPRGSNVNSVPSRSSPKSAVQSDLRIKNCRGGRRDVIDRVATAWFAPCKSAVGPVIVLAFSPRQRSLSMTPYLPGIKSDLIFIIWLECPQRNLVFYSDSLFMRAG